MGDSGHICLPSPPPGSMLNDSPSLLFPHLNIDHKGGGVQMVFAKDCLFKTTFLQGIWESNDEVNNFLQGSSAEIRNCLHSGWKSRCEAFFRTDPKYAYAHQRGKGSKACLNGAITSQKEC